MFGLFRKKKNDTIATKSDLEYILSNVKYGVNPHDDVPFSTEEKIFFQELVNQCKANGINPRIIRLTRLSNKGINVTTQNTYIGKIKLYGRKTYMQIVNKANDVNVIESQNLNDYISAISHWIKYMK